MLLFCRRTLPWRRWRFFLAAGHFKVVAVDREWCLPHPQSVFGERASSGEGTLTSFAGRTKASALRKLHGPTTLVIRLFRVFITQTTWPVPSGAQAGEPVPLP